MKDRGVRTVHATDQLAQKIKTSRLPTRAQQLTALRNKDFDVLVVGGGATGCGVALDAASRGNITGWLFYTLARVVTLVSHAAPSHFVMIAGCRHTVMNTRRRSTVIMGQVEFF